jgi:hypothetical protein
MNNIIKDLEIHAAWQETEAVHLRRWRADLPFMPELAEMHENTALVMRNAIAEIEHLRSIPYSLDEQRVVNWLLSKDLGGGDDPIGFLLASYEMIVQELNELKNNRSE